LTKTAVLKYTYHNESELCYDFKRSKQEHVMNLAEAIKDNVLEKLSKFGLTPVGKTL